MFPHDEGANAVISGMIKNPYNQTVAVSQHLEQLDVVTTSEEKFFSESNGLKVWGVGLAPLKGIFKSTVYEFKIFLRVIKLLRKNTYDVIHVHHLNIPLLFVLRLLRCTKAKIIYTAHGTSTPELNAARQGGRLNHALLQVNGYAQHFLDYLCWNLADLVILPSAFQRAEMVESYGVNDQKLKVIHNGYDADLYRPSTEQRTIMRERLGLAETDKALLFVGRAAAKKGITELISACDKLRSARQDFRLVLVVGYMGRQTAYRDTVKSLAAEREWVSYFESVPEEELPSYYNAADLCVFPSFGYESLPTVIFEAAACQKPILTQGAWGIPEAISEHFVDEKSILTSDFDQVLSELMDKPANQLEPKYQDFERFSWKNGGEVLAEVYRRLVEKQND